jgi:hypothetical protein
MATQDASQVEERLQFTAYTCLKTMEIDADAGAQDRIHEEIRTATNLLLANGLENDDEALLAAQIRLVSVLLTASAKTVAPDDTAPELALRMLATQRSELRAHDIDTVIAGLCPGFWPFC